MRYVGSEIGRLKKVMVHAPGPEVDIITPDGANSLLFEDIIFGDLARTEHQTMCKIMQKYGVETVDILDLLAESIEAAPAEAVDHFLQEITKIEELPEETSSMLDGLPSKKLAQVLIEGMVQSASEIDESNLYILPPVPNLIFARDPVILFKDRILASSMAENARKRESKIMVFIFTHHPELKDPEKIIDLSVLAKPTEKLTLEGGDFLVINENTVAIAWSVRTTLKSIRKIGEKLKDLGVENLVVVKLPPKTAFIHLDTTFTRISEDECVIYPPLYSDESNNKAEILYFNLKEGPASNVILYDSIFKLFADIGIRLRPIYCGGKDGLINQCREQWTQGANCFCLAPGIILTYARNVKTIEELKKAGYLHLTAKDILTPSFIPDFHRKTVISFSGEELCRARGGPRCLTHPLLRS